MTERAEVEDRVGWRAYVVGSDLAAHDVVHNNHFDGEKGLTGLDGRKGDVVWALFTCCEDELDKGSCDGSKSWHPSRSLLPQSCALQDSYS